MSFPHELLDLSGRLMLSALRVGPSKERELIIGRKQKRIFEQEKLGLQVIGAKPFVCVLVICMVRELGILVLNLLTFEFWLKNLYILKLCLLYSCGWCRLLLVVVSAACFVLSLVLVLLVISVVVLNTCGGLLGLLKTFMFAIEPVFILDEGRCVCHLLPVTILKK